MHPSNSYIMEAMLVNTEITGGQALISGITVQLDFPSGLMNPAERLQFDSHSTSPSYLIVFFKNNICKTRLLKYQITTPKHSNMAGNINLLKLFLNLVLL